MKSKIFCIGLPRTGTTTFATMMNILGYNHCGNNRSMQVVRGTGDYDKIYNFIENGKYDSFDDHPWSDMWKELNDRYPDAKFVNLVRNPIDWSKSFIKMASNTVRGPDTIQPWRIQAIQDFLDDPTAERFVRRNKEIREYFGDNFIELDWNLHGYKELCNFLNIEEIVSITPHVNMFSSVKISGLNTILSFFNEEEKDIILKFMGINK